MKCIPLSHLPLWAHSVTCVWWEMWRQREEDFGSFWSCLVVRGSVAFSALVLRSSPVQHPLLACSFCICWRTLSSGCLYHRFHCLLSARPCCPRCTKQDRFPPENASLHLYAADKTQKYTHNHSFILPEYSVLRKHNIHFPPEQWTSSWSSAKDYFYSKCSCYLRQCFVTFWTPGHPHWEFGRIGEVWKLIPSPLENDGLELTSTELWCSLHQVWKLPSLSNVIGSTCHITTCLSFVMARKRLLWSVEEAEHLTDT